jgi:hypothetical protein
MGAALGQTEDDGSECIVACIGRSLNIHEKNYSSYEGEMLAAVWADKALDYYLRGAKFTLVTDHSPLTFLMANNDMQGQYARWSLILQEYNITIKHRPGVKHQNADVLSRYPLASTVDNTGARLDLEIAASSTVTALAGYAELSGPAWDTDYSSRTPVVRAALGLEALSTLACCLAEYPEQPDNTMVYQTTETSDDFTMDCTLASSTA